MIRVAALALLVFLTGHASAHAQDRTPLRASYEGTFLPAGTNIVVLSRAAREERFGRLQPEFIAREAYPRRIELVYDRDVLDAEGFSSRLYERTDRSAALYFLYAVTPDSSVYWSYSAQRDSLKFDVVGTGVMSVAPIRDRNIREDVLRQFFRQRVVVHMPETGRDEPSDVDSGEVPKAVAERSDSSASPAVTSAAARPSVASAAAPTTESSAAVPSASSPRRRASSEPFGLTAVVVVGLFAAGSLYFARKYRTEARRLRLRLIAVRDGSRAHDEAEALRRELDEMRAARQALRHEQDALQERLAVLEEELARDRSARREHTA